MTTTALRILVVTVVHDPEDARIRYRQIPALREAGHAITYAAPFHAFGRTVPTGVHGIDLPRATGRRRLVAVRAARRLILKVGPSADVILLHDPDLLLAAAGLAKRVAPIVWDVHEDTAAALSMRSWVPNLLRRPLAWAVRLAERLAERRFHLLLAEHSYRQRFRKAHPVVPNSVRVPADRPEPPGPDRVVYLGKISRARGGEEMLALARAVPELTFQLIGPAEAALRPQLAAAHRAGELEWFDFLPNEQALAKLPGALAGLALLHDEPNYARSLPTKLVEYLAHGVPVVSTPNQTAVDLVERSGGGAVVPFGDVSAAAAALRRLAADETRRRSRATSGYDYVAAHVNWNRDGAEFVRVIEGFSRS
ncbi:glycosyltransferase [Ruania zhangjianzhongii]|uniref:glycosyltransferase n=1 Tax=Ruania zhangjianzhongii TaxID=2603206 RepID=UPI001F458D51|nr:glycosyltransferase [Ruania zhangjianzhongii]